TLIVQNSKPTVFDRPLGAASAAASAAGAAASVASTAPPAIIKGEYYTVRQGDCISSIAARSRMSLGTLWDDDTNAALRNLRDDPYVSYPGDRVFVRDVKKQPDQTTLQLRLLENMQPRKELDYSIQLEGEDEPLTGRTDNEGLTLKHTIPALVENAIMTL